MRVSLASIVALATLPMLGCQGTLERVDSYLPASQHTAHAAASESVIHSFGGPPFGELPEANPIVDGAGRLYGTTMRGGTSSECGSGCGTIFELSRNAAGTWHETTLWSFDLTHGAYPSYPIVADAEKDFFGATDVGGDLGAAYGFFHRQPGRQFRDLHDFRGNRDGAQPRSNLTLDKRSNLYGTTVSGGTGGSGGGGTVYELIPSGRKWRERIIYRFSPYKNGESPQAGVIFGRDGGLYGTTTYGGNYACASGCGVVYRLTPSRNGKWTESVLHAFDGSDGASSAAALVPDGSGNLYGTTNEGGQAGCFAGCGTLFKLSPGSHGRWSFAVLHYFAVKTGGGPLGNMAFDARGNLFGTTVVGGNVSACQEQIGCGVVFELSPEVHDRWKYTVLHTFSNSPDGALATGVVIGPRGKLYGTTIGGGTLDLGTVFEVTP